MLNMLNRNSFTSKIQPNPLHLMMIALMLSVSVITSFSAFAEGGVTGGGGTADEICYFIDHDGILSSAEVSHEKICKEPQIMMNACNILTGTEDCTGYSAVKLREIIRFY